MSENRKSIPLSPEARAVIERQLVAFQKKFGREPGLTDPIFFDPDSDEPRPISQQTQDEDERGSSRRWLRLVLIRLDLRI